MKKSKYQWLQRAFTFVAAILLFLQVATPVGVAFAEELNPATTTTTQSTESSIEDKTSLKEVIPSSDDATIQTTQTTEESTEQSTTSSEKTTEESTTSSETTSQESTSESQESTQESAQSTEDSKEPASIKAAADEPHISQAIDDIFTFEKIIVDGQEIKDGDVVSIEEGSVAEIRFAWNTEGKNAQAGDTASVQLSDAFKSLNITTPQPIMVGDVEVGTYVVKDGLVTFTFNKEIENDNVKNGFLDMNLEFNLEKFKDNVKQEIPFNDETGNNITIIAKPKLDHSGITKSGTPDSPSNARNLNRCACCV